MTAGIFLSEDGMDRAPYFFYSIEDHTKDASNFGGSKRSILPGASTLIQRQLRLEDWYLTGWV
jgi:hypothetical protein